MAENKTYNSEAALSYAVQMAYYAAQKYYSTKLELDSGKGYADIVYLPSPKHPDKPALLVCNASDPYGREPSAATISFRSFCRNVKVYSGERVIPLSKCGDEYSFELGSDRAVLITFE